MGILLDKAWQTHPEGLQPDERTFNTATAELSELIDNDIATLDAIHRYVCANAHLFEKAI